MRKIQLISWLLLCFICIVGVCGCAKDSEKTSSNVTGTTTVKQQIVGENFNMNGSGVLKCTQAATAGDDIDVDLEYKINYKNGNILELVSVQKVTSDSLTNLELYEDAYNSIAENYDSLKYYDTKIIRDNSSVTYTIVINYDKIDINQLLAIEGAEDNIVKNGKAKLSLWLELAGRMGVMCEER